MLSKRRTKSLPEQVNRRPSRESAHYQLSTTPLGEGVFGREMSTRDEVKNREDEIWYEGDQAIQSDKKEGSRSEPSDDDPTGEASQSSFRAVGIDKCLERFVGPFRRD